MDAQGTPAASSAASTSDDDRVLVTVSMQSISATRFASREPGSAKRGSRSRRCRPSAVHSEVQSRVVFAPTVTCPSRVRTAW
ncbi:hypothetical protein WY02_07055 [Pseudonocardia sp. AL041005-10]|nr:hypothetical protein WY02_07055 [Pseudonocardia sp. AL041005-10]